MAEKQFNVVRVLSAREREANGGEDEYLNHSLLSTRSFGSRNMAWKGSYADALAWMVKAQAAHKGKRMRIIIREVENG